MRYLTKSRFKLALECMTKLYYTRKEKEYANEKLDDPFLRELARGGFQVGELAKFLFCENPVRDQITIETLDYGKALEETTKRLRNAENIVIAEAAFGSGPYFVRTDILRKTGNTLEVFEVKAKSIDGDEEPFIAKTGVPRITSDWEKYLYDIAFQKHVVVNALKGSPFTINAHLVLVDKSKRASVDGLNQKFKIHDTRDGRPRVEVSSELHRKDLGDRILRVINVDDVIDKIWNEFPVPAAFDKALSFEEFLQLCVDSYQNDKRVFTPVGARCKKCEFAVPRYDSQGLKDGRLECWKNATGYSDEMLKKDRVYELSAVGTRDMIDQLVMKKKFLVESVDEGDIRPKSKSKSTGLSWHERRMEQINAAKVGTTRPYLDKEGLKKEMANWAYPLHMIDFETTMTALPFHKNRRPYEGIAFQFSHHVIEDKWTIRHAGQYLSFKAGEFPNYDFVRALKSELEKDIGSIFRYHNHENTYLRIIHRQLEEDPNAPEDKAELQAFIDLITTYEGTAGPRTMIDLYKLVVSYYYSPVAKGSNSIKQILPAIVHDSGLLRDKYSKPIYGKGEIVPSLNFDRHVWINTEFGNDPYKTLQPLFENYDVEELDRMVQEFDELADGGAAMTAYNILQFSEIPEGQRKVLEGGLLRYCELDTMAMVMIVEGWKDLISR